MESFDELVKTVATVAHNGMKNDTETLKLLSITIEKLIETVELVEHLQRKVSSLDNRLNALMAMYLVDHGRKEMN